MVKSRSEKVFDFASHLIMIIMSLTAVLPILLIVTSSFTENSSLILDGYSYFPKSLSLENYRYLLINGSKILKAYGVSIMLTVAGTALGTSMTLLMGYGLSRQNLPGRKLITFVLVLTLLFNGGLVPTYMVYTNMLHVKNTFWGLLLPSLLMNGFNIILVKSYFFTSVPNEILEAAEIDGAGEFRKFTHIALPMAVPIIATIGMFTAMGYWNDWNNGYVYISTRTDLYSIQNLLNRIQQNLQFIVSNASTLSNASSGAADIPSEGVRMAICVIGVIPVLIAYPFVQRFFVKGITLGGVKG